MGLENRVLETLRAEVKAAMGCTEPVAVALAVAKAKELCVGTEPYELQNLFVDVKVSPNIFKNGLSVGIPNTDQVGLMIAVALSLSTCHSINGLEVFKEVTQNSLQKALKLLENKQIVLSVADTDEKILVDARVSDQNKWGHAVIQARHDQFVLIENHLGIAFSKEAEAPQLLKHLDLTVKEIIDTVEALAYKDIHFLLEGLEMNRAMAEYGLNHKGGMSVGLTLSESKYMSDSLMTRAMILTAAASDARMSGAPLPVMSSNGSGNNGITALLPIVAYAKETPVSDDQLARAAAISHLVNSVIKNKIGRLSALCGCGVAAGTGASVALTWLMKGDFEQIEGAIKNMIANTTGMICDGAKIGCSLKLATSASAAVQSSILAMSGIIVPCGNGIIAKTADETIANLGVLSKEAMGTVDRVILGIMTDHIEQC